MSEPGSENYVIIGGGGQVGYFLAREIYNAGYEVILLEKDGRRAREMEDELGDIVIRGDACEARTLENNGCDRATFMIAVTGDDEDNLVMCQVARELSQRRLCTIARVNNIANIELFRTLKLDHIISLTDNILDALEFNFKLPLGRAITKTDPPVQGVQLVEYPLAAHSPWANRPVAQFPQPDGVRVVQISRRDQPIWASDTVVLAAGDVLTLAVTAAGAAHLQQLERGQAV